jgi:hypothetical protein
MTSQPNRNLSAQYEGLGPLVDVTGVNKTHGLRAVRWLRDHRSALSFYDPATKTLRAPETKFGAASTRSQMEAALVATKLL